VIDVGLFVVAVGLFVVDVGLFVVDVGLFVVSVGLCVIQDASLRQSFASNHMSLLQNISCFIGALLQKRPTV